MLYATLLVGEEYCTAYSEQVNNESLRGELHVLTDSPKLFPTCRTYSYFEEEFSYFDKLIFLTKLVIEYKQRITFVDADWCRNLNFQKNLDSDSVYCWKLFTDEDLEEVGILRNGVDYCLDTLKELKLNNNNFQYPGEAILSMPYNDYSDQILSMLEDIKPKWEKAFHRDIDLNRKLKRYASYGVGYCEGAALKGVLDFFNVKVEELARENFEIKRFI